MDKVDVDQLIEKKNVSKAAKKNKHLEPKGISLQDIAEKSKLNLSKIM